MRAYTQQIYRAALGLRIDPVKAEDRALQVWLTFFEVLPKYECRSKLRSFLFGILYNKIYEEKRDQKKSALHDPIEEIINLRFDEKGAWLKPPQSPERFGHRLSVDVERYESLCTLHVIPPPCPLAVMPVDFSHSEEPITAGYINAKRWLESEAMRPTKGQADLIRPHHHPMG